MVINKSMNIHRFITMPNGSKLCARVAAAISCTIRMVLNTAMGTRYTVRPSSHSFIHMKFKESSTKYTITCIIVHAQFVGISPE